MKNNNNYTSIVIRSSSRELFYKILTSIIIRGLLLIIPVFWSNAVNYLSDGNFYRTYFIIVVIVILSIFYYVGQYLNQVTWFLFYDKLYLGYSALITKDNSGVRKISLAEYTNVINNDIDILCNFLGNGVARIIQIIEIFFIYFYFLSQSIYIFIITFIVSILMIVLLVISSNQIKNENIKRKSSLDKKTVIAHQMYDFLKDGRVDEGVFKKFHQSNIDYLKANKKFNLLAQALIYFVLGIIELSKYGIIIYSIYLISRGYMEVGTIILVYTYYDKIIANFEVLGTISAEYQSFLVSLKRLNRLGSIEKTE